MTDEPPIVSTHEIAALIEALAQLELDGHGDGHVAEHKLLEIIRWITTTRVDQALQQGLLTGRLLVDITGDDPDHWKWINRPETTRQNP